MSRNATRKEDILEYDLIISGAMIYDGTGKDGFVGDIGIIGDRIAKVADSIPQNSAKKVINAKGLAASPGFIDVHTHDDVSIFISPEMEPKLQQGVTSIIIGNCGFGISPKLGATKHNYFVMGTEHATPWETFSDYLNEASLLPLGINVGALSGHGTIKTFATAEADKEIISEETLRKMCDIVDEELSAGSFGVSFGLAYAPGRFSKIEELISIAKIVNKHDAICTYHMRDEGRHLLGSVEEVLEITEKSGAKNHISHFKSLDEEHESQAYASFIKIMEAKGKGERLSLDCYPYISAVTALREAVAWKIFEKRSEMFLNIPLSNIKIACSFNCPELNGLTMDQVANNFGVSQDEVFEKLLEKDKSTGVLLLNCLSEKLMKDLVNHPDIIIASDSIPLIRKDEKLHPRLYGTFPRVLSDYTRKSKIIELKSAIRKMTGLPAKTFMIKDRGFIKEGYFADIVIFDPDKIEDKATYEKPEQFPDGISKVFVNGKLTIDNKKLLESRAGKVLKRNI